MWRKLIIFLFTLAVTLLLFAVFIFKPNFQRLFDKLFTPLKKSINCIAYEKKNNHLKLKDGQSKYIKLAIKNGILKCDNEDDLLKNTKLTKIENSKYFIIDYLTHSYPYLTESGKSLLNKIGENFNLKLANSELKDTKFYVTSLTRTTESIERLRKCNKNSNKQSAHLYGECFDITYTRFLNRSVKLKQCHLNYLKEVLASVIFDLKKNKKCWAVTETKQTCFHVVTRKNVN
mgnify:CR=1 FL=1